MRASEEVFFIYVSEKPLHVGYTLKDRSASHPNSGAPDSVKDVSEPNNHASGTTQVSGRQQDIKNLFYLNQMTTNYKREENNMRRIIRSSAQPTNLTSQAQLLIDYKIKKLKNFFIKSNLVKFKEVYDVVYKYECNERSCRVNNSFYNGRTTVRIKE